MNGAGGSAPHEEAAATAQPRRSWPRRAVPIALVFAAALVAYGAVAAWHALDARADALAGLDAAEAARDRLRADASGDVALPVIAADLERASERFRAADDRLGRLWLAPLRATPLAGTQLRAAARLTSSGVVVAEAAGDVVRAAEALRQGGREGSALVAGVEELHGALVAAQARLADVPPGSARGLVGSLADAYRRFERELADVRTTVDDMALVSGELAEVLRGPRHLLLVAANNAEMHAGSGAYLLVGSLHLSEGGIVLDRLDSPGEQRGGYLPEGVIEVTDADLTRNFGWLRGEQVLVTLGATPRFDANARVAADHWAATTGEPVDGVLLLDSTTMAAILAATGPVEIDGERFDADTVVDDLLYGQYAITDRDARQARLQRLLDAALGVVFEGRADPVTLVRRLGEAARGRHVLAWSRDADQQAAWRALGIDGRLAPGSVLPFLTNLGATKLDPLMDVSAEVTARATGSGLDVAVRMAVENRATGEEHDYVVALASQWGLARGTYFAMVGLAVPGEAADVRIDGEVPLAAVGTDGPGRIIATWLELPAGSRQEVTVRFTLPSRRTLRVEPSARVPGVRWSAGARTWIDDRPVEVDLADVGTAPSAPATDTAWIDDPVAVAGRLAAMEAALGPLAAVDTETVASWAASPSGTFDVSQIADEQFAPLVGGDVPLPPLTRIVQMLVERRLLQQQLTVRD